MRSHQNHRCAGDTVIRIIATLEGLKGLLVLLVGFALLGYIHADLQSFCEDLVRTLHLNPASAVPRVFIASAGRFPDSQMKLLVAGAAFYAIIRFVEAFGLWQKRAWAEWFALISCGLYLPVESYEMWRRISVLKVGVLLVNAIVVAYLWLALRRRPLDAKS